MRNHRGFTLVEMTISVAILGMLTYLGMVFARQIGNSEETILRSRDSNEAVRRTLETVAADFRNSNQGHIVISNNRGLNVGAGLTDIVEFQTTLLAQREQDLDGDGEIVPEMEAPGVDLDGDGRTGEQERFEEIVMDAAGQPVWGARLENQFQPTSWVRYEILPLDQVINPLAPVIRQDNFRLVRRVFTAADRTNNDFSRPQSVQVVALFADDFQATLVGNRLDLSVGSFTPLSREAGGVQRNNRWGMRKQFNVTIRPRN